MGKHSITYLLTVAFGAIGALVSCQANPKLEELLEIATKDQIVFSADGQSLFYTQNRDGGRSLTKFSIEGGLENRIAKEVPHPFGITISPETGLIAVCGMNGKLYVLNSEGNATPIEGVETALWPQFSPSGSDIVFSAGDKSGKARIEIVSLDSGRITALTTGEFTDILPVFSGDGQQIILWRAKTFRHSSPVGVDALHDWQLCTLDLDSRELKDLNSKPFYKIDYSRPIPAGSRILFCLHHYMIIDLWEYNARNNEMKPIDLPREYASKQDENGDPMVHIQNPKLMPGRHRVLFEMAISEVYRMSRAPEEIYALSLDDGTMEQLTNLSFVRIADFDISPDGQKIAVLTNSGAIYLVDLETRKMDRLK